METFLERALELVTTKSNDVVFAKTTETPCRS
jgi:hypothetical protein